MDGIPLFEIPIPHFDKFVHFVLFCVHAILIAVALYKRGWLFGPIVIGLSLGLLTELMQSLVPGRQPDVLDFLANTVGVTIGVLFIYFVKKNEYV